MERDEHLQKMVKICGMSDSETMYRIIECAMTSEEARFLVELPASFSDLAAKFDMDEKEVEDKILGLAQRGLLSRSPEDGSPEKFRFTNIPAILHDNILSSAPQYIPDGMAQRWMDLYRGDQWINDIGEMYGKYFKEPLLRVIPAEKTVPPDTKPLSCESISEIIEANRDLITVRNCCCRVGADICHHPLEVCMQFKGRAEFDQYRGSGRNVSVDEAVSIAMTAVGSGLVPTVTNISRIDDLDFICFLFSIAGVAESADARDSKSRPGNRVWVQVPPPVLN